MLCFSCEEYFVPEINEEATTFIFEGELTDQINAHCVKIFEANAYDDNKKYVGATGFSVYIEDENGFKLPLAEVQPGYYKPDSTVIVAPPGFFNRGIIGSRYRLVAKSPEGKEYNSEWEVLNSSAPIDSLFCKYDEELVQTFSSGTGYREQLVPGMSILNNLRANGHASFYKYEFDIVYQSLNYYTPLMLQFYAVRPESSAKFNFISLLNANPYSNKEVMENKVYFLPLDRLDHRVVIDSIELDYLGRPRFLDREIVFTQKGFLIQIRQYSLSQKGFEFWDAIYKQGNATGQVFDPVVSQAFGNMTSKNDSSEMVLGYFGASAIIKKDMYMNINNEQVFVKPLKYFPYITAPMAAGNSFDFWVNEFLEL